MKKEISKRVYAVNLDDDLDEPIYRIFPVWFFEQAIQLKSIVLVPPAAWEDPFEDVCMNVMVSDYAQKPFKQESIAPHLPPTFAQCWSYENHSDALLRAYSRVTHDPITGRNIDPRSEGARVKTTPRRLLKAATAWSETRTEAHFYLGKVEYVPEPKVGQDIANLIKAHGIKGVTEPDVRANTLLVKRDFFRHEAEVRLLGIGLGLAGRDKVFHLPIDPNEVFLEVEFDPRLKLFENRQRQERAKALGYSGKFAESPIYTKAFFDVPLNLNLLRQGKKGAECAREK